MSCGVCHIDVEQLDGCLTGMVDVHGAKYRAELSSADPFLDAVAPSERSLESSRAPRRVWRDPGRHRPLLSMLSRVQTPEPRPERSDALSIEIIFGYSARSTRSSYPTRTRSTRTTLQARCRMESWHAASRFRVLQDLRRIDRVARDPVRAIRGQLPRSRLDAEGPSEDTRWARRRAPLRTTT